MLTEPDMQARYVAATLHVIEAELLKLAPPTADRSALSTLVSGAAKAAARLADDLAQPARLQNRREAPRPEAVAAGGNVIAFRR